jgi:hypothetical protein
MEKPKMYKKTKRGQPKPLNRKVCKEWEENHKRNPLTNRVLKVDGRTYRKLKRTCDNLKERTLEMIGRDFILEKSEGDGNCFFHSVLMLVFPEHLPPGFDVPDASAESGHLLREFLEKTCTMKDYVEMLGGVYAQERLDIEYPYTPGDDLLNVVQLANKQAPELKRKMKAKIKKDYERFKRAFADYEKYADEGMVEFTARKLRINIVIYNTEIPDRFVSAREIFKNRSSIFLYNWDEHHFDPLRGDNGERVWKWRDIGRDIENL